MKEAWKKVFLFCFICVLTKRPSTTNAQHYKVSIFHAHNYDGSSFRPIFVAPLHAQERSDIGNEDGGGGSASGSPPIFRRHKANVKLSNPLEYAASKSTIVEETGGKLTNPWESPEIRQGPIQRDRHQPNKPLSLPKYVTQAKKFLFDIDDEEDEILQTSQDTFQIQTTYRPITFPSSQETKQNQVTFPTVNKQPHRRQSVLFNQQSEATTITTKPSKLESEVRPSSSLEAILPTPLAFLLPKKPVRKIANNQVMIKPSLDHKLKSTRGSESFLIDITTPASPSTMKPLIKHSKPMRTKLARPRPPLKRPQANVNIYQQQIQKLRKLINAQAADGDIQSQLLQQTVPLIVPNIKSLQKMTRLEEVLVSSKGAAVELHQEDFFVFHTTLVQLQKILEAVESKATSDIKPLLKRAEKHNMSLIKILFGYIFKSARLPGKRIIIEDTRPLWKHYSPLKELFPFL